MNFSKVFRMFAVWAMAVGLLIQGEAEAKVRIAGTIKDLDGNPIPNATIEVTDTKAAKTKTSTSGKDGKWAIIVDGKVWKFVVKAEGFETYEEERPVESLGAKPTLNFKLAPASGSAAPVTSMPAAPAEGPAAPQVDLADLKAGNDLFDQGKYQEALASYQQALAKNPTLLQIHLAVGDAQMKLQNWAEAEKEYAMIPEGDAKYEWALVGIGKVKVASKDYDAALDAYKKVLAVNAQNPDANYMSGTIYFDIKGDAGAAQKYLEAAATAKPDWAPVQSKLGYVYINVGDNAKAKAAFQKYLELEPSAGDAADIKSMLKDLN